MKITIVAVDLRSPAWASTAVEDYLTRFPRDWKVELKTVKEEPRHGQSKSDLMAAEADRIRKAIPKGSPRHAGRTGQGSDDSRICEEAERLAGQR